MLLCAAVTAFLVVSALEESGVLGADHLVVVGGEQGAGADAASAAVRDVARTHRVDVGRLTDDLLAPGELRHLYLAVGRPDGAPARWLRDGYPAFAPQGRTDVHDLADLGPVDPRGHYVLFGDAAGRDALAGALRGLGYEVTTRAYYAPGPIAQWVWLQPFGTGLLVAALLAVVLVAAGVLAGVRTYAVQRLHGAAGVTLLLRDLRDVARVLLVAGTAVAGTAGLALLAFNGLRQWRTYAAVALGTAAALLVVVLVAHAAAIALTGRLPVLEGLQGRLPTHGTTAAVYLVRVPAVVLMLAAVATATLTAGEVAQRRAAVAAWRTAGDAALLSFSPVFSPAETDRLAEATGRWLADEDAAGRLLLTVHERLEGLAPGATGDVLLVNGAYLTAQDVRTADGARVTAPPPGTVRVLVPAGRAAERDALRDAVAAWAPAAHVEDGGLLPADAELFTYGAVRGAPTRPLLTGAVVVALGSTADVVRPADLMAWASQGGVLVRDARRAVDSARDAGLGGFVTSVRPAGQEAADTSAHLLRDLRLQVANVATALLVLLATAVGVGQAYTRAHAQRLFVMHVHGRPFARTHAGLLTAEGLLLVGVVGASVAWTVTLLGADAGAGHPAADLALGGRQPLVTAAWATLDVAFVVVTLVVLTRRLVRTRSAEA